MISWTYLYFLLKRQYILKYNVIFCLHTNSYNDKHINVSNSSFYFPNLKKKPFSPLSLSNMKMKTLILTFFLLIHLEKLMSFFYNAVMFLEHIHILWSVIHTYCQCREPLYVKLSTYLDILYINVQSWTNLCFHSILFMSKRHLFSQQCTG